MIGRHIHNLDGYLQQKAIVQALTSEATQRLSHRPVEALVNTGDGKTEDSVYLTVTGLSAEAGDDGQVGRGNRVNGLITPYRPMSLEAAAGKNPVTHVGKLYNVLAHRIAAAVVNETQGDVEECYCYLLSQIGRSIDQPQLFEVKVRLRDPQPLTALAPQVQSIAQEVFGTIGFLWREIVSGTLLLW